MAEFPVHQVTHRRAAHDPTHVKGQGEHSTLMGGKNFN